MAERLISKETTRNIEIGGVIAGLIGMISGIAALEWGGFGAAAGGVIYDIMKNRQASGRK